MKIADEATEIYTLLANSPDAKTAEDITNTLNISPVETGAALAMLIQRGLVERTITFSEKDYYMLTPVYVKHTIPILHGLPEWAIATEKGKILCWCHSEIDAKLIKTAFNRR